MGRQHDLVNHPAHYTTGGIEMIDYIRTKLSAEDKAHTSKEEGRGLNGVYLYRIIRGYWWIPTST